MVLDPGLDSHVRTSDQGYVVTGDDSVLLSRSLGDTERSVTHVHPVAFLGALNGRERLEVFLQLRVPQVQRRVHTRLPRLIGNRRKSVSETKHGNEKVRVWGSRRIQWSCAQPKSKHGLFACPNPLCVGARLKNNIASSGNLQTTRFTRCVPLQWHPQDALSAPEMAPRKPKSVLHAFVSSQGRGSLAGCHFMYLLASQNQLH